MNFIAIVIIDYVNVGPFGFAGNLPPINHSHSSSHNINQENHDSITSQHTHLRSRSVVEDHQEPPRPPPPRAEGNVSERS